MCWVYRQRDNRITIAVFLFQFILFTVVFYFLFNWGVTEMTQEDRTVAILSSALIAGLMAICCTFGSVDFIAPKSLDEEVGTFSQQDDDRVP